MVNWKLYRITNVKNNSVYIIFEVNDYVDFCSGSFKRIDCANCFPFDEWNVGDYIEIDNDKSLHRRTYENFTDVTQVRLYNKAYSDLEKRHDSLEQEHNNLIADRDHWKREHGKLERERNDLRNDLDEWRRKYEELNRDLSNERLQNAKNSANERLEQERFQSALQNEKKLVEKDLANARNEITSLKNLVEAGKTELSLVKVEKDNQLALVRVELTEKDSELKEVEKALSVLRVESEREKTERDFEINKKEEELKRKEEEINDLRNQKEFSEEELLIEKLRSEEGNLELFAAELKVDSEKKESLIKDYEQLIRAQKTRNRTNVNTSKSSIDRTKRDLQNGGISLVNVREVCRKCERIAELNWELEQIQQQQFEAKQEIPTNN